MATLQVLTIAIPAAVGLAGLAWTVASWRKTGSQIEAELAVGNIDYSDGLLSVEFPSGDTTIMTAPNPDGKRISTPPKRSKRRNKKLHNKLAGNQKTFNPVNVIFAHNKGRTAVTLSRCEYLGYIGEKIGFQFEPQPGVSPYGDHLPKRIEPGQDVILIHDYKIMKAFLNEVMRDHDVDTATFVPVLILGDGSEVSAHPRFEIHAAAGPDITDIEYEIWRQEEPIPHFVRPRRWPFLGRR
ncbi:MAG: hypothetical protein ACRDSM_08780 [Pseudonocardiaceae bacterium]